MDKTAGLECDVLIVGGGPAGSACGRRLVREGFDVLIMDKANFPRDKVCAGWITPPVVEELQLDLNEYAKEHVLQPIHGFRTGILGGPMLETIYPETVSYAIRRCEFDGYLLHHSGARTLEGTPFRTAERSAEGWLVNGSIRARLLIGAGGHFCPVSRLLNPKSESSRDVVLAQEAEFLLSEAEAQGCAVTPEQPELYFYGDLKGYAWCVRKENYINIGLGRMSDEDGAGENLPAFREEFLKSLLDMGRMASVPAESFRGHAYRIYRSASRRVVDDRLLLIGDAAGLASPQSGEGIRPAIESGLLAAGLIVKSSQAYRREELAGYEELVRERFGHQKPSNLSPTSALARLRAAAARRLLRSPWFTRHVLLDRWFLQRHIGTLGAVAR